MTTSLRWAIAAAACVVVFACGDQQPVEKAPEKEPLSIAEEAAGVDCSWKCHCGRQLGDCDEHESQHDICIDARYTEHDGEVADCDECKRVAAADCARRTCPPDPAKGPKFVLEYVCDGRSHTASDIGDLEGALEEPASVSVDREEPRVPADLEKRAAEEIAGKGGVTCTFACTCMVETGVCDDHETRYRMCSDKQEKTERARDCDLCEIRARVACWDEPCPLAAGTAKTLTRFSCP